MRKNNGSPLLVGAVDASVRGLSKNDGYGERIGVGDGGGAVVPCVGMAPRERLPGVGLRGEPSLFRPDSFTPTEGLVKR